MSVGIVVGDGFLSPDLDGEYSNSRRRWLFLKWIWIPYSKFKHRSPLTHVPVIADIIRLAYLAIIVLIVTFAGDSIHGGVMHAGLTCFWLLDLGKWLLLTYPVESGCVFSGLVISTALHGSADAIVSEGKKMIDGPVKKRKNINNRARAFNR